MNNNTGLLVFVECLLVQAIGRRKGRKRVCLPDPEIAGLIGVCRPAYELPFGGPVHRVAGTSPARDAVGDPGSHMTAATEENSGLISMPAGLGFGSGDEPMRLHLQTQAEA
jgi:hypothetical protein